VTAPTRASVNGSSIRAIHQRSTTTSSSVYAMISPDAARAPAARAQFKPGRSSRRYRNAGWRGLPGSD